MHLARTPETIHLSASACALGMFDGVHMGHRMVLESAIREARILGIPSVVFSFAAHPQFLLSQTPTRQLSTLDDRLREFEQLGFDYALILDFDDWLKNLSPKSFIEDILIARLGIKSVSVGYDHCFGKDRAGNGDVLKAFGETHGFGVNIIEPVATHGQIVSSTIIRKLLTHGDIEQANSLLGRAFTLTGMVVSGHQRGRQLGFPTANLALPETLLTPATGTYGGYAYLNGKQYQAVCNVGFSPTFEDAEPQKQIEVHFLDYDGPDFYGAECRFEFLVHLREEMKFPTVDALIQQIQQDCSHLRSRLLK